jgi:hypothetical protein
MGEFGEKSKMGWPGRFEGKKRRGRNSVYFFWGWGLTVKGISIKCAALCTKQVLVKSVEKYRRKSMASTF